MSETIQAIIEVEKCDSEGNVLAVFDVQVEGDYEPACAGSRDRYGVAEEPDTPARMYYLGATDKDGAEVELSKEDVERAMEALWNEIPDPDDRY